ncbi:MAG TPA: folylpolyglutamate synthase/dihydrofolate synthase family protein [Candidatus Dormibacteraeota bacterium]|nr:folylpolyglutamate synthase/dihydrofolate synthase family protein [Candidatus Dormibacteraeota bacterium]
MDYASAVSYLESSGRFGIKLGLERVRALLDVLGSPDEGMRGVLVGGTNGKGSTCAYLVSILAGAGYKVGSMPKPHLQSYTERVCIDGKPISEAEFARMVTSIRPAIDEVAHELGQPTEFEMLTAGAVKYMREAGVDWLVCEVGLGGTLDATNVLDLGVKVITNVDLDHMQYLGGDIASIAEQKAGIIRDGDLVITGQLDPAAEKVARRRAGDAGAELWELGQNLKLTVDETSWKGSRFHVQAPPDPRAMWNLETRMLGAHQAENAALAVAAAYAVCLRWGARLGRGLIRKGLLKASWPGRLELVRGRPLVLIDGGHNPAALARIVAAVQALLVGGGVRPVVLFGAMSDKDVRGMLAALPEDWPAVYTAVIDERAMPAADVLQAAEAIGRAQDQAVGGVPAALAAAKRAAGPEGLVLVAGSLYLAGEARTALGR